MNYKIIQVNKNRQFQYSFDDLKEILNMNFQGLQKNEQDSLRDFFDQFITSNTPAIDKAIKLIFSKNSKDNYVIIILFLEALAKNFRNIDISFKSKTIITRALDNYLRNLDGFYIDIIIKIANELDLLD